MADTQFLIESYSEECAKLVNGQCTTLRCVKRGGWGGPGTGDFDPDNSTCEALETIAFLRQRDALHAKLSDCANRLETIRETHPDIHLDDDIASARAALAQAEPQS